MLKKIKQLLGIKPGVDLGAVIAAGCKIIDVRTPAEYAGGHIKGSVNIPLNVLAARIAQLKKDEPIVTCCASGMRSSSAKRLLQVNGFTKVYNGGGWQSLKKHTL